MASMQETDVFVEIHTKRSGTLDDIFAIHLAGEGFVFHPLSYRFHVHFRQRFAGLDQRHGGNESGEFITGKEALFQLRIARHTGVLGMRHDGATDDLRIATLL